MNLSSYHQKYTNKNDEEIQKRADVKERELVEIFKNISLNNNVPVRLAVLGCGDKRFIGHHKRIFEKVLRNDVDVTTFDITIDHLKDAPNVLQHDCTKPLPNPPYDITYGHVLLKFIQTDKQFNVLRNSFDALNSGGIAIHLFDFEEIKSKSSRLEDALWSVPLDRWKKELSKIKIQYKEIPIEYGLALVLLKNN